MFVVHLQTAAMVPAAGTLKKESKWIRVNFKDFPNMVLTARLLRRLWYMPFSEAMHGVA